MIRFTVDFVTGDGYRGREVLDLDKSASLFDELNERAFAVGLDYYIVAMSATATYRMGPLTVTAPVCLW